VAAHGIFGRVPVRLQRFPGISGAERVQYIQLVVAQLRAGKLALSARIKAGGSVFGRLKSDGRRMREIWNGSAVAAAAAKPPPPPHLVSPSCFAFQELRPGQQLYVSKRDAKCWFDQLRLPRHLEPYMGRPRVSREELISAGLSHDELRRMMRVPSDGRALSWHPVARVWGMGFSWSSTVAQQTLLSVCRGAGLGGDIVLSPEAPVPYSMDLQFGAATDDAIIFSTTPGRSLDAARRLDSELKRAGVERNMDKDVDEATSATCVGVDLVDGCAWDAPGQRVLHALEDMVSLMKNPVCSPLGMAAFLGSVTWYDLLCRSKLSCYHRVYEFTRRTPEHIAAPVPGQVISELACSVALTPWWHVPLRRPFSTTVVATDASTDFGFGGCAATLGLDEVRRLSRLCSRVGDRVVLDPCDVVPPPKAVGKRHHLGAAKQQFRDIFSIRAGIKHHINIMEVGALNMGLEWWLRSSARHNTRGIFLLDSRVAIGGAAKGRSSSGPLLRGLRRTAALVLAGSLQPYYVFIGTRDNPSDGPSRGLTRKARETKLARMARVLRPMYEAYTRAAALQKA